jgi:hypothetical protein
MLLHINGNFKIRKLKSALFSQSFVLKRPALSISGVDQGMKPIKTTVPTG